MSEQTAADLRQHYLERLDRAMQELPYRVASELRSGIAEELDGSDPETVARRISDLGAPEEIARAAAEESHATTPSDRTGTAEPRYLVDTRGFALAGALVLAVGGFILPLGGWAVGAGMVTSSRFWFRWEKAAAILAPAAGVVAMALISLASRALAGASDAQNPLIPAFHDVIWSGVVFGGVLSTAGGLWLLWRLKGRPVPVTRSRKDRLLAD